MSTKQLSTSLTLLLKFIIPSIWIIGMGAAFVGILVEQGTGGLVFGLVYFPVIAYLYYSWMRAKVVYSDESYLYIGNFIRNIKVPLNQIKAVKEGLFLNPRPIFFEFKTEAEFGSKIMFIGYIQLFNFFSSHPAVKMLKSRILF